MLLQLGRDDDGLGDSDYAMTCEKPWEGALSQKCLMAMGLLKKRLSPNIKLNP